MDTINNGLLSDSSTQWFCAICGSRNSKAAFDLHGLDWTEASLPDSSLNSCTTPTDLQFHPQHASTPTRSSQQDKWKERPLRVLNINFQSANAKRAEIPYLLESLKPDIILGTETWLHPTTATAEILPDFYKVYRRDRGGRGGGVLVTVRNSLDSYVAPDLEVDDCSD